MNMGIYLIVGLLISLLWVKWAGRSLLLLTCGYWFLLVLWSLHCVHPFTYNPVNWAGIFHISLAYHIDGLSNLFTLLVAGIGIFVLIYAHFYTQNTLEQRKKLYSLLQLFAVSMFGLVIADDMILLFLAWELTSIASYLLIQFNTSDNEANQVAFNSLFITVMGSLFLLVSFIIMNYLGHTWSIQAITHQSLISTHPTLATVALVCLLLGVVTKSAQWPFHFWLVGAMKAPTPVSAYLHSATMVNAGIYLLARFHPIFDHLPLWYTVLSYIGLITMFISSLLSLFQTDLKSIFAYTTVFALGIMTYLLASTHPLSIEAFAIFLLFHAVYKAGAFMLAGAIDKIYHSRDLAHITGIGRQNPTLIFNLIILLSAMAGLPPFFGFTLKEMIIEAKIITGSVTSFSMFISLISSMLIAATSIRCLFQLIQKKQNPLKRKSHLRYIFLCPTLLCVLILTFDFLAPILDNIIKPTVNAILLMHQTSYVSPKINNTYLLSFSAILGGVFIFMVFQLFKCHRFKHFDLISLRHLFEKTLQTFLKLGDYITYRTQYLSLSNQTKILLLFISALIVPIFVMHPVLLKLPHISFINGGYLPLIFAALALSLLKSRHFLINLISLSLIGIAVTLLFIFYGAVDLAITQLVVEVLVVVILLIILNDVSPSKIKTPKLEHFFNFLIACLIGFITTVILLNLRSIKPHHLLKDFYITNSFALAHGKNVVNVILVDFRSFDTFGEVLVICAMAIVIPFLIQQYMKHSRHKHVDYS